MKRKKHHKPDCKNNYRECKKRNIHAASRENIFIIELAKAFFRSQNGGFALSRAGALRPAYSFLSARVRFLLAGF